MDNETGILWAIGIVAAAIMGWLGKITHMLTNLAEHYVPRNEINRRFDKITGEFVRDLREHEEREQRCFDKIDARFDQSDKKLDTIIRELARKADRK